VSQGSFRDEYSGSRIMRISSPRTARSPTPSASNRQRWRCAVKAFSHGIATTL
jgi:hypothetical protein